MTLNIVSIITVTLIESRRLLQERGKVYLLVTLSTRNVHEQPPTVAVVGESVSFQYAVHEVLEGFRAVVLRDLLGHTTVKMTVRMLTWRPRIYVRGWLVTTLSR